MSRLQLATQNDYERLFKIRSMVPVWTGKLTIEQYIERTRRIFSHPFARRRIETWMLLDSSGDQVLSSMDVLNIEILKAIPGQAPQFAIIPLITSLVTAPDLRFKGYAAKLMSSYCESRREEIQVLYSDINPHYYTKFKFRTYPVDEIEVPLSNAQVSRTPVATTIDALIQGIRHECLNRAHEIDQPSVINLPTTLFMDWHVERYRYFAECTHQKLPQNLYWKLTHEDSAHAHFLAAAPDFVQRQLDCLWITPDCPQCVAFSMTLAREWELERVRYWTRTTDQPRPHTHSAGSHACVPMIRVPDGSPSYRFLDPQICTWF